ncbi:MAG TPA: hypothetical protein VFO07_12110 [Roseiflexaceae bacterium]|nr:hypothetical protein [Roseiflexaceae bacterium]
MYKPASVQTAPRPALRVISRPQTWHGRAVQAYWQTEREEVAALQAEMVSRIAALIRRDVEAEAIYVDRAERTATVAVDGVVFRLRRGELVLQRTCPECCIGRYESPAVRTLADLGYALSAWQPPCVNCQAEDPANWLDGQDF